MASKVSRLPGTLLLSALALAGCAVPHSPAAAAVSHAATASAAASQASAAAQSPRQQRAESDAAVILAAFEAPPGARKLPGPPQGQASQLTDIAGGSASPNWIEKTGYWQVKGDPQQVLAWTASHVGRTHTALPVITHLPVRDRPETVWERDYALPPVPAVEDTRELTVEVADAGNGQTAIRVDAQVTWLPARTASEMVPAAAAAVTLSVIPDGNLGRKPPQPQTITSPAQVRRITAMINSLPAYPPGGIECGVYPGGAAALVATFLAAPRGTVLATAIIDLEGCEPVIFAAGTTKLTYQTLVLGTGPGVTMLGMPLQGSAFAAAVLKTAGSTWKLSSYSQPSQ